MSNRLNNLKNGRKFCADDEATKQAARNGGLKSAETRREKKALEEAKKSMTVELVNAIQAALKAEYKDKAGKKVIGINGIAYNLITTAMNSNNRQCIAAIKIILEIFGANISAIDVEKKEADINLAVAKTDALNNGKIGIAIEDLTPLAVMIKDDKERTDD